MRQHEEVLRQYGEGPDGQAGDAAEAALIQELLTRLERARNQDLTQKLSKQQRGMLMCRLCGLFYEKEGSVDPWPNSERKRRLRDFIKRHGYTPDVQAIQSLARELGLGLI